MGKGEGYRGKRGRVMVGIEGEVMVRKVGWFWLGKGGRIMGGKRGGS